MKTPRRAEEMPYSHLLYYGKKNPFEDTDSEEYLTIFDRCANANSKFTLHARLRELLEFRKIYGPPS